MRYLRILMICVSLCLVVGLHAVTLREAKVFIEQKDYPQAVVAFRSLMQQSSYARNADCNKWFGQALCMTGAYQESIPYLEYGAKYGRTGAWWYLGISRQHLYDFEGAIQALENYRKKMPKNSLWIPRTDSILAECQVGLTAMGHIQDVEIIDSIIVAKQDFFAHYKLGAESGRVLSVESCGGPFTEAEGYGEVIYENQSEDYRLMIAQQPDGDDDCLYVCESHFFAEEWEVPKPIASVKTACHRMEYPFMRTDGETLYFACDSTPGMGGLDIYRTTYNADGETFYRPERLGMPFNSPYDDYMMAIDETHQVGWWATERASDSAFVCIYLFRLQQTPRYLDEPSVTRARIDRIADSWKSESYAELLQDIYSAPQRAEKVETLYIPIDDRRVYHSVEDFKSPKAREEFKRSQRLYQDLVAAESALDALRIEWREATSQRQQTLRPQILQQENRLDALRKQCAESQKQYRNLEIGF